MSGPKTRSKEEKIPLKKHPLFGVPHELKGICLPTVFDVMRHFFFEVAVIKHQQKSDKDPPVKETVKSTANKVIQIWQKA